MKMINLVKLTAIVSAFAITGAANAQVVGASGTSATQNMNLTVESKALIAIYSDSLANLTMTLAGASQAGAPLTTDASNTKTRMRITSSVQAGTYRRIDASLGSPITATNTELLVKFSAATGFLPDNANQGTVSAQQNLTNGAAHTVVYGITSCYSGILPTSGYPITYTYQKLAGASTYSNPGDVVITYTISDEGAGNNTQVN